MQQVTRKTGRYLKNAVNSIYRFLYTSPRRIGSYLAHGLIIIIPLAVTLWLIIWVFNLIDGILGPILASIFGRPVPGLGFFIIIAMVILIGVLGVRFARSRTWLGQNLVASG